VMARPIWPQPPVMRAVRFLMAMLCSAVVEV
jgi:hypothetical protein